MYILFKYKLIYYKHVHQETQMIFVHIQKYVLDIPKVHMTCPPQYPIPSSDLFTVMEHGCFQYTYQRDNTPDRPGSFKYAC